MKEQGPDTPVLLGTQTECKWWVHYLASPLVFNCFITMYASGSEEVSTTASRLGDFVDNNRTNSEADVMRREQVEGKNVFQEANGMEWVRQTCHFGTTSNFEWTGRRWCLKTCSAYSSSCLCQIEQIEWQFKRIELAGGEKIQWRIVDDTVGNVKQYVFVRHYASILPRN